MSEVKTAQATIEERWPAHAGHQTKGRTRAARWSTAEGIVCACGDVLGWPDPEHPETLAQYTKRIAQAQVDAASAPGRTQGAFGSYSRPTPEPEDGEAATVLRGGDNAPEPGDYPDPEVQEPEEGVAVTGHDPGWARGEQREMDEVYGTEPARHDDDPGPEEPEVDWGSPDPAPDAGEQDIWATVEPPADEPEPEHLAISDADEAQAGPPYAVGDTLTVAGVEFTKHSESPFPEHNREPVRPNACPGEVLSGGRLEVVAPCPLDREKPSADWSGKWCHIHEGYGPRVTQEVMDRELDDAPPEIPTEEIGRDLVPYAGTPIMPTEAEVLDPLIGRLAPLDPTLPYTPADVELKIVEILRQLENSELFLRQQLARLHQATHNYNMRYNLAYRTSDGRSDGQRKADAVLATEREAYEMTEAEMLVRALRDSQHNLRAQLSGFQSVARSLAVSLVNSTDGRSLPPEPPRWN